MLDKGFERVVPTTEAEETWTARVQETAQRFLFSRVDSWMTGVNKNLPNKQSRSVLVYTGGAPKYRELCDEVAANGYEGFELS